VQYKDVVDSIENLCADQSLKFDTRAQLIQQAVDQCPPELLIEHLEYAGVIPERFGHDSTQEKLFAKYCDALLARAWRELGLAAEVIVTRSDSADVMGDAADYSIVGDAKAFRLSRTAKNQKDFKVESLNKWRKKADFACLVAPRYQYPNSQSQIYDQAARYNVCLLSYTHLAFLVRNPPPSDRSLRRLWNVSSLMPPSKNAVQYWKVVDQLVIESSSGNEILWQKELAISGQKLAHQAIEQSIYWQSQRQVIIQLPHDEAVQMLIKALKIDEKIETIQRHTRKAKAKHDEQS
jgi:hypothetical protein